MEKGLEVTNLWLGVVDEPVVSPVHARFGFGMAPPTPRQAHGRAEVVCIVDTAENDGSVIKSLTDAFLIN